MTTPTPITELVIRQREQRTTERPGIEFLDVPLDELKRRMRRGEGAEVRHLLCDADPDSTVPAYPYLIKSKPARETTS